MNNAALFFISIVSLVGVPSLALAHQPRIVTSASTVVVDPEISKAYYGKLEGDPHVYRIEAQDPFELYVNVLVPGNENEKKDVSFAIIKNGDLDNPLVVRNGNESSWEKFFEEYGHDTYWRGAEFKSMVSAGVYDVHVWSSNNDSKYSLAIGEKEFFDAKEGLNALYLIPEIKREFFGVSPVTFILSPLGALYAVFMVVLGAFLSLVVWGIGYVLDKKSRASHKNLGRFDRVIRVALGTSLFLFAIITNWNPIVLILSGYVLFEAAVGWCGLYRLVGRNTCGV